MTKIDAFDGDRIDQAGGDALALVRLAQGLRADAARLTDDYNAASFAVHQVLMEALRPGHAPEGEDELRAQVRTRLSRAH